MSKVKRKRALAHGDDSINDYNINSDNEEVDSQEKQKNALEKSKVHLDKEFTKKLKGRVDSVHGIGFSNRLPEALYSLEFENLVKETGKFTIELPNKKKMKISKFPKTSTLIMEKGLKGLLEIMETFLNNNIDGFLKLNSKVISSEKLKLQNLQKERKNFQNYESKKLENFFEDNENEFDFLSSIDDEEEISNVDQLETQKNFTKPTLIPKVLKEIPKDIPLVIKQPQDMKEVQDDTLLLKLLQEIKEIRSFQVLRKN